MLVVEGIVSDRTVFYEDSHSSFHGQRGSLLPQRHSDGVRVFFKLDFPNSYYSAIVFALYLANSLILQNKMQILVMHFVTISCLKGKWLSRIQGVLYSQHE